MSCIDAAEWRASNRRLPPNDQLIAGLAFFLAVCLCLVSR